jgi:protein-disulfide isomerase
MNMAVRAAQRLLLVAAAWLVAAPAWFVAAPALGQDQSELISEAQKPAFQELIREYILANPEVVVQALQLYEEKRKLAEQEAAKEMVTARWEELANDPFTPVVGNPEGDVTVVEFFDYRCPYCISVAGNLRANVQADGNIRLVMKEFPILGPESDYAARVALAAGIQGEYEKVHFAFMSSKTKVTKDSALKLAEKIGLDMDRLRADIESEEINQEIQKNRRLATELQIRGTPSFVIGNNIVRGAVDMTRFRQIVEQVRANSS